MLKFLFIGVIIIFVFILIKANVHIKWSTFFKKGFKKLDNMFGIVCYCAKQRKTEKHTKRLDFAKNSQENIIMKL